MNIIEPTYNVGVMVCRFQVPDLHEAHIELINSVAQRHPKVIVFLGLSPCKVTRNNPLDFDARKQMLQSSINLIAALNGKNITIMYIKDEASDEVWSKKLDNTIKDIYPGDSVCLYGGRDSFLKHYKGQFATKEFEQKAFYSGTELRKEASRACKGTADFRAGVIWAAHNQYPKVLSTVDVAIYDEPNKRFLMARKPTENKYRFVGGFADPNGESFEADASREVKEETRLDIDPKALEYIGSFKIDDWRYRGEVDKIRTTFFLGKYTGGTPVADDDIAEVRWFTISELLFIHVVEEHQILMRALNDYLFDALMGSA
jgi:bifunctional NMN adenylyltransferase/nudix hydrolase